MSSAQSIRSADVFDEWEITYKHEVAANIRKAREAVEGRQEDWLAVLKRAFGAPNNLTAWQMHDKFLKWCEGNPDQARAALGALVGRHRRVADELHSATPSRGGQGHGSTNCELMAFLSMAVDPDTYPMYRTRAFKKAIKLSGQRGFLPAAAIRDIIATVSTSSMR